MCTMQAPHRPAPQPNLVPVSLRPSRMIHNSGVSGGASVEAALPFTVKLVAMCFLPKPRSAKGRRGPFFEIYLETPGRIAPESTAGKLVVFLVVGVGLACAIEHAPFDHR